MPVLSRATSLTTQNLEFYYLETWHCPEFQLWRLVLGGTVPFFAASLSVAADAETQLSLLFIKGTGRSPDETRLRRSVVKLNPPSGGVVACYVCVSFFLGLIFDPPN